MPLPLQSALNPLAISSASATPFALQSGNSTLLEKRPFSASARVTARSGFGHCSSRSPQLGVVEVPHCDSGATLVGKTSRPVVEQQTRSATRRLDWIRRGGRDRRHDRGRPNLAKQSDGTRHSAQHRWRCCLDRHAISQSVECMDGPRLTHHDKVNESIAVEVATYNAKRLVEETCCKRAKDAFRRSNRSRRGREPWRCEVESPSLSKSAVEIEYGARVARDLRG